MQELQACVKLMRCAAGTDDSSTADEERQHALSRLNHRHLVLQALSPTTGSLHRGAGGEPLSPVLVHTSAAGSQVDFPNLPAETSIGKARRPEPETFDLVRALRPDLILLDLAVGIREGFDLLERLAAEEPTRDIPVIVLSTTPALLEEAHEPCYSADTHLEKPFDVAVLLAAIGDLLRERAASHC
jgi:CheY-like chemotaxis protein